MFDPGFWCLCRYEQFCSHRHEPDLNHLLAPSSSWLIVLAILASSSRQRSMTAARIVVLIEPAGFLLFGEAGWEHGRPGPVASL